MLTTRTPPQACPQCGKLLDATTHLTSNIMPKAGDLTACIECQTVLTFEPGMVLRVFTKKEMAKLPTATLAELERQQRALAQMHLHSRRANSKNN